MTNATLHPTEPASHVVTRDALLARRDDLYAALRTLDGDLQDGTIDDASYRSMRERYELEAAGVLRDLDRLEVEPPAGASEGARIPSRLPLFAGLGVVAAAVALFLGAALRDRANAGVAAVPTASPAPQSAAVVKAQRALDRQPNSLPRLLALGNAYLDSGDTRSADGVFQTAMARAPRNPEPPTLHAMVLGSAGHRAQALSVLGRVEATHPSYSRAWLLDGLIASRDRHTLSRAVTAWNHFLALQPNGDVARTVRTLLAQTKKREAKP